MQVTNWAFESEGGSEAMFAPTHLFLLRKKEEGEGPPARLSLKPSERARERGSSSSPPSLSTKAQEGLLRTTERLRPRQTDRQTSDRDRKLSWETVEDVQLVMSRVSSYIP